MPNYAEAFMKVFEDMKRDKIAQDLAYADMAALLDHCTMVSPHELLSTTFPENAEWDRMPAENIKLSFRNKLGDCKLEYVENEELHMPLKDAFNACCDAVTPTASAADYAPTSNLKCVDMQNKQSQLEGLSGDSARSAPDLCLAFHSREILSPDQMFSLATVSIVVESDGSSDWYSKESWSPHSSKKGGTQPLISKAAKHLMLWAFSHVSSQWFQLPYRFVWSITITGDVLRIWRWSNSGVLVTESIDYINDATPVYQFLQAIGKGPYSRLGLDIGSGMTFSGVEQEMRDRVKELANCYLNATSGTEAHIQWYKRALQGHLWRSQQPSSILDNEAFDTRDPADTASQNQAPVPRNSGCIYVISHPIWCRKAIYSRDTRCYLAIYQSELNKPKINTIEDLHLLKTCWQRTYLSREVDFFSRVQAANTRPVPHLATMLAAGSLQSTTQLNGEFIADYLDLTHDQPRILRSGFGSVTSSADSHESDDVSRQQDQRKYTEKLDSDSAMRSDRVQLQWILFKQVGERLSGFRSVKELLQVIYDAVEAHESLYQAGVLHGHISENNILIDLGGNGDRNISTRRGLLIDLDMAHSIDEEGLVQVGADAEATSDVVPPNSDENFDFELTSDPEPASVSGLKPKPSPKPTGTLLFMSIAKKYQPRHHCWHDLESFYWLLLIVTLRHVQGVVVTFYDDIYHLDDAERREHVFQLIFNSVTFSDKALINISRSKADSFQSLVHIKVAGNQRFTALMMELYYRLEAQYSLFSGITRLTNELQRIARDLKRCKIALPLKNVYMASGTHEVQKQLFALSKAGETICSTLKRLQNARTMVQNAASMEEEQLTKKELAAKIFVQDMNVSEVVCDRWKKALEKWMLQMSIHQDSSQELEFLSHEWLKEKLLKAIAAQEEISPIPTRPVPPKPIENVMRGIRSGASKFVDSESRSSKVPSIIGRLASGSGPSRGSSPSEQEQAGSKRKRAASAGESLTHDKRRKTTHHGNASSGSLLN